MLKIALVGLPNVGKSTLFNALTRTRSAQAENYPFCTIEPNVGIVEVPDIRLQKLAEIVQAKKVVPAAVEFVDVAGLVRDAHKGEGLGNQFLSHIRECDAIALVTRFFEDDNIIHVAGKVHPESDLETILLELIFADLQTVEKRLVAAEKAARSGSGAERDLLLKLKESLEAEQPISSLDFSEEETELLRGLCFLTSKPMLVAANVSEDDLADFKISELMGFPVVPISAKLESELVDSSPAERAELLESLGVQDSGLDLLIQAGYSLLGLQTYFTAGEIEARAWTVHSGATAPQAAGVIHSDFHDKFIKAEVVSYADFVEYSGWAGCRDAGKLRIEGKDYIVQEGEVIFFKHGG